MNKEELIKNISDFRKNTIKMVKNGDPYNYCCKTIDVQFGVN